MKHKLKFLTVLIFGIYASVYSQDFMRIADSMQGAKFSEITNYLDQLYEGKDTIKSSGWKPYQRWKNENEKYVDANGYLINQTRSVWNETYNNNTKASTLKSSGSFAGNWTSFGNKTYINVDNAAYGGNGRVNCIVADPDDRNILYAGTPAGGLWRSTDAGINWAPLTDGMPNVGVSGIAIDPNSPVGNRTIYILTGDGDAGHSYALGVFKSVDNGNNWYLTGLEWDETTMVYTWKLALRPGTSDILYAATDIAMYKSTDGGLSWNTTLIDAIVVDFEFNPANPDIMYASTMRGKVFKTVDAGESWTDITGNGLPTITSYARVAIAVTPDDPNYLYAYYGLTVAAGQFTGMYLSTDGGDTFTLQSNTPNITSWNQNSTSDQSWYDLAIAVSPTDKNTVFAGGVSCWKSTDAGITWTEHMGSTKTYSWGQPEEMHLDLHALEYIDGDLYCGNDGGIHRMEQDTELWDELSSGLEITQFYRLGANPNIPGVVHGGAQDNGVNKLMGDTIYHWAGGDGGEGIADPYDPQVYYGSSQGGSFIKTTDNGLSKISIRPQNATGGGFTAPLVMDPNNNQILYAGYSELFKTTDAGISWENITNAQTGSSSIASIALAGSDSNCIYISTAANKLYKTTDGGATWNLVLPQDIDYIAVHPFDKNKVWAVNKTLIYKSIDGGSSWTNITGNFPAYTKRCVVYQKGSDDRIYIGTDFGVYFSDNNSNGWVEFNEGLPRIRIYELEINYVNHKIRAATFGRGIWESDLYFSCNDASVVNVEEPVAPTLKSAPAIGISYAIEAESFTTTGGTYSDAYAGGPGYGVNRGSTNINYVNTNDWAEYNLPANIESGIYSVEYYISTPEDNAQISLSIDNGTIELTDNVVNNGLWDTYYPLLSAGQITIENGVNSTFKLTASGTNEWQWNLDRIVLTKIGEIDIEVEEIQLAPTEISMVVNDMRTIIATVLPENASNKTLTWSSDNESVATVNQEGAVEGISAGEALITATSANGLVSASCTISVEDAATIVLQAEDRNTVVSSSEMIEYTVGNTTALQIFNGNKMWLELPQLYTDGLYRMDYYVGTEKDNVTIETDLFSTEPLPDKIIDTVPNTGNWDSFVKVPSSELINLQRGYTSAMLFDIFCESGKALHIDRIVLTRVGDLDIHPYGVDIQEDTIYIGPGKQKSFYANIKPSNTTHSEIEWSISNPSVINIDTTTKPYCWITSAGAGEALLTVTTKDGGYKDSCVIIAVDEYVDVTGIIYEHADSVVGLGDSVRFIAKVQPENATDQRVRWSSYLSTIASVNQDGWVKGEREGTAEVRAWTKDVYIQYLAEMEVEVKIIPVSDISLSSSNITIVEGQITRLTATVLPENASDKTVSWNSSDEAIATVNENGEIEGLSEGEAIIIATSADGLVSASCSVTVEVPYTITLEAEDRGNYASSSEIVEYTIGDVTAIKVYDGNNVYLQLPQSYSSGLFRIDYYIATNYENVSILHAGSGSNPLDYISNIPNTGDWDSFTKVSSPTLINLQSGYDFNLYFTASSDFSEAFHLDRIELTRVGDLDIHPVAADISQDTIYIGPGKQTSLSVSLTPGNTTYPDVTWSIDDSSIVSIAPGSYGNCTVYPEGVGTAVLTVTTNDGGIKDSCVIIGVDEYVDVTGIVIENNELTVGLGGNVQFKARVLPENATDQRVKWSTYPATIASVDENGLLTGHKLGTTRLTAGTKDNYIYWIDRRDIEVINVSVTGLSLSHDTLRLAEKEMFTVTASVIPGNAANQNINWSSSNPSVASVVSNGNIVAHSAGTAVIMAVTEEGGFSKSVYVEVFDVNKLVIEAEGFATTGGTVNDAPWGGPGYGVNNAGTNINWVNTGDWATYPLTIHRSGKYRVDYNISTPITGAAIELSINGVAYTTDNVPNNGEWDAFQLFTAGKILQFEPGDYTVQVKGVGTDGWEWNLDNIELVKVGEACYTSMPTPELKQANVLTGFYKGKLEGIIYESDKLENEDISEANNNFSIYPNPTSSQFTISFNVESNQPATIQIRNILGELQAVVVDGEILEEGKYELNYNVENLVSGMYLITFKNGTTNEVKTLVVE